MIVAGYTSLGAALTIGGIVFVASPPGFGLLCGAAALLAFAGICFLYGAGYSDGTRQGFGE